MIEPVVKLFLRRHLMHLMSLYHNPGWGMAKVDEILRSVRRNIRGRIWSKIHIDFPDWRSK